MVAFAWKTWRFAVACAAWKVSKYRVFSGPYFPVFGLNTERYFVSLRIQSECGKIRTRKKSIFGHFSRSTVFFYFFFCQPCPEYQNQPYRDFGPCHNVKSNVFCDFLITPENGSGHFKEQLKLQARVVHRKNLLVILSSAVRKLNKILVLWLLTTNYWSVYSIYLFHLSFYLTMLRTAGSFLWW